MARSASESAEGAVSAVPSRTYEQGVLDGLDRHTWMRDGVTYVGNGTYTLRQAIQMAAKDLGIELDFSTEGRTK